MLVSTDELASHLGDPTWVVFDCRHDLMDHSRGPQLFAAGHVPGASFAAVESALAGRKTAGSGRHPLPAPEDFAAFLTVHGVTPATRVVAYDDAGGLYAARLWWLARWIGFDGVALLDGGYGKWSAEGRPISTAASPARPAPAPLPVRLNPTLVKSVEAVLAQLGDPQAVVLDARAAERYRGDVEPIDPVAGHIPGALNRFFKTNLQADLTLRPAAELAVEFRALLAGRRPEDVAHSCGSGITACANLFAMEYAGLPGSKLYAGSWSEWVADRSRPVEKS